MEFASTIQDPQLVIKELEIKMKELADHYLGTTSQTTHVTHHGCPFTPMSSIKKQIQKFELGLHIGKEGREHVQTKLPPVSVPVFDGDLETFLKEFERWLRITGVFECSEQVQLDWLIQACTPKVKKNLLKKSWKRKVTLFQFWKRWKHCFLRLKTIFLFGHLLTRFHNYPLHPIQHWLLNVLWNLKRYFLECHQVVLVTKANLSCS